MAKRIKKTTDALEILDHHVPPTDADRKLAEDFREKMEVAEVIYQARSQAGLTQQELARRVGTTPSVISRLEDAEYQGHSLAMLRRIATALGQRVEVRFLPESSRRKRA